MINDGSMTKSRYTINDCPEKRITGRWITFGNCAETYPFHHILKYVCRTGSCSKGEANQIGARMRSMYMGKPYKVEALPQETTRTACPAKLGPMSMTCAQIAKNWFACGGISRISSPSPMHATIEVIRYVSLDRSFIIVRDICCQFMSLPSCTSNYGISTSRVEYKDNY